MEALKYKVSFMIICILMVITSCLALAKSNDTSTSVVAVGDNLIHPVVYQNAQDKKGNYNFKPMYKHVRSDIQKADVAYINQESPMGGDNKPLSGFKQFNSPSEVARDVIHTGFNLINGANNHSLDQGDDGVNNHINIWNQYKNQSKFTGIFNSEKANRTTPIIKSNGIKISLLSYTYGTNGQKSQYPYTVKKLDKTIIQRDLQQAKRKSDAVIVSAHWGNENSTVPNQKQKQYAQLFADEGADVVLGMHPHVIQPVKWVKGKHGNKTLVAYSLGNFLNGQYKTNEYNQLLGRLNFKLEKTTKGVAVKQVKWRSMVNHYEQIKPLDKRTRYNFKVYNLKDYRADLAQRHGLNFDKKSEWNIPHLKHITHDIIDKEFLDDESA